MDQMRTALRGLAETAAPAPADDPASLWSRGRRRVRRRRLAAVGAVAAAVVAAGALSVVAVPTSVVYPAGTTHEPAVPRNVWDARDWYPTTGEEGPPGVVAVLGGLPAGDGNGLFTVSATTGEYRILELPDAVDLVDNSFAPALAPDGRHVAYWLSGEPSGEPYGNPYSDQGTEVTIPVGIGVYDTVDGSISRYEPGTEHGLAPDDLVWADGDTLLATYGQRTSPTSSDRIATYAWDVLEAAGPDRTVGDCCLRLGRGSDGALVELRGARRYVTVPLDGGRAEDLGRLPRSRGFAASEVWSSPRAVVLPGNELLGSRSNYGESRTMLATVDDTGRVGRLQSVDGDVAVSPVGWIDDRRMLVTGPGRTDDEWGAFYRLDTATGDLTRLGTADAGMYSPGLQVATDLLRSPLVDGVRPPATDPQLVRAGGIAVLVVLAAGVVLLIVRRRRA